MIVTPGKPERRRPRRPAARFRWSLMVDRVHDHV